MKEISFASGRNGRESPLFRPLFLAFEHGRKSERSFSPHLLPLTNSRSVLSFSTIDDALVPADLERRGAMVAFVLMAIILAHIYIGSVGMEGAYDAMGTGEVDEAWAHQHHSLWLEDVKAKQKEAPSDANATPAE